MNKADRENLRMKYGGKCAYCGQTLAEKWHADHLEPVRRESEYVRGRGFVQTGQMYAPWNDTPDNLMPSCIACNVNKSDMPLETWRTFLERRVDVLRGNAQYRHALRFGLLEETNRRVVFFFEQSVGNNEQAPDRGGSTNNISPESPKER